MAAFAQDPWIDGVQQHSLRCITGNQNKAGARAYTYFKDGKAQYGRSATGTPGKWEQYRSLPPKAPLPTNEKFIVRPNFEGFEPTGDATQDAANAELRK